MATPGTAAAGQLAAAKTDLYVASTAMQVRVSLCNVGVGNVTATLYIKKAGGSSTKVCAQLLAPGENFIWPPGNRWDLASGDTIEGTDAVGASTDFVVSKLSA